MHGTFSRRIPVTEKSDEFDTIAIKINQMLTRIEALMESMQQVTNNVAHDLRSPLTRLRNRLEVEHVPMGDLATELAELYGAVAEDANLLFVERINSNPIFYGNRHLLAQAITNLLDNAIKYTRVGGLVGIYLSGNQEEFTITVTDNGPGIPKHERERVLQRFVRLENERKSQGNGPTLLH